LVPFESLGAVSYSPSIVTVAVSVAVCEIRYDSVYLTCSKKLTGSQLSLPHGYSVSMNGVTLKTRLGVVQGH